MSLEGAIRVKLLQELKALLPMMIRDIVREELDKRDRAPATNVDRDAAPEVTKVTAKRAPKTAGPA